MTLVDAAGLALLALHNRRLVAAVLRTICQRASEEDIACLPIRRAGESILAWACRGGVAPGGDPYDPARVESEAREQITRADALNITGVVLTDAAYPPSLAAIPDPPPVLWVRGAVPALSQPAVGIVGARAATPYALEMARRLAMDLAAAGVVIVSGLARGVDGASHAAALAANGETIGVLGCGLDRIYPAEHRDLGRRIVQSGALVSEFPAGVPPLPHHFPLRNRIISGLARAVVVIEASQKSGSLITAAAAAEQGRDVLVVPGHVLGGRNRGGHLLIRDGARLVESADDVLQELGVPRESAQLSLDSGTTGTIDEFTVDEESARTGEAPDVVLARLLELELTGRIQRVGGGRFIRVLR